MTIYDIAAEAGVSITTVSRVLNKQRNVSTKTLGKVMSVLERHNYHPNLLARSLVTKSTHTIGVLTVDVRDAHYAAEAYIIEQEWEKLGYSVLLCNTGGDPETQIRYMKLLLEKRVDGIILVGSVFNDPRIDEALRRFSIDTPVMMINGSISGPNIYSVFCDNGVGVRIAAEHLIARGRKRICYFQDTYTYSGFCKVTGYTTALKTAGLDFEEKRFLKTERGIEGGSRAVDMLIAGRVDFDAIMTGEDITALGAAKRLKEMGYHIPGKVAVVGFNNSIFSQCADPELTTVDTKMVERLSLAVRLLHEVLEGKEVPPQTLFLPELIIKGSS